METQEARHGTEYLSEPLTRKEVEEMQKDNQKLYGCVMIPLEDVMGGYEYFLDSLSLALIGSICLQEITFHPVDVAEDGMAGIVFEVSRYVDEDDYDYLEREVVRTRFPNQ